ncbi:MAG TPA: YeeE/YedE thiosulfate transporter family protein [Bacillota bacterium]
MPPRAVPTLRSASVIADAWAGLALGPGLIIALWLVSGSVRLAILWLLGLTVGFAVQRSRLCFLGAVQDALLFGLRNLALAVIILLWLTGAGFAVVQILNGGTPPPGNVHPVGLRTVVGGVLFGLGMVLSGGCVLTTLVRLGEGGRAAVFVLAGLVIGGPVGKNLARLWVACSGPGRAVHLPATLGWPLALAIEWAVLGILWWCLRKAGHCSKEGDHVGIPD